MRARTTGNGIVGSDLLLDGWVGSAFSVGCGTRETAWGGSMSRSPTNAQIRKYFDKHAAGYDRQMGFCERHLLGEHRGWATSQASGDVLELAVGTGLNLTVYPRRCDGSSE